MRYLQPLAVGGLMGLTLSLRIIALGALVFSGAFAGATEFGTGLMLAMTVAATAAIVVLRSAAGGAFATAQDSPIAVLMPVVLGLGAVAGTALSAEAALATVLAVLGLTSVLTGAGMLLVSAFDRGRVARLIPYSVLAGYLGSAGVLLILSVLLVQLGETPLPALLRGEAPDAMIRIALALGFAVLLHAAHLARPGIGLIVVLIAGIVAFFPVLSLFGMETADARALGLLPQAAGPGGGVALSPDMLGQSDFGRVLDALPVILSAAVVALLGGLLNISGVEMATRAELDTRRALRNTGLVNVVLGFCGASPGYPSASNTSIAVELGGAGRVAPAAAVAVVAAAFFLLTRLVDLIPSFVTGGLLVQMGWLVVERWILRAQAGLGPGDRLVAVGIVAVSLVFGIVEAVAAGLVAASVIFAITYARLPILKRVTTLKETRSAVDRGPRQTEVLDRAGARVEVLSVQGFLFFGSVEKLVSLARTRLRGPQAVTAMLLDFGAVSGVDASAVEALRKLEITAQETGARLAISGASPDVHRALTAAGLFASGVFRDVPVLDTALQAEEDALIAAAGAEGAGEQARNVLLPIVGDPAQVDRLLGLMERRQVKRGEHLIRAGETGRDIYLIDTGRMAVMVPGGDGRPFRVRAMQAGAIVGEIAAYAGLPRTADVIAETDSVVYALSAKALEAAGEADPALVALWHKVMAAALADKLHRTTQALRARA
jgi:SulP family sulfate permease